MTIRSTVLSAMLITLLLAFSHTARADAPSFQDLMAPSAFPEAQRGMCVEKVTASPDSMKLVTTGAELRLTAKGDLSFRQRIGHKREVLRMHVDGMASVPTLARQTSGLALLSAPSPRFDLRANGDSLFMFHAHEPLSLTLTRTFDVAWGNTYKSNAILLDEYGGIGLYGSDPALADLLYPYGEPTFHYTLPADAVLWIAICPPKPYDWERSLKDQVVWHWSQQTGYPSDKDLTDWTSEGNIVLLQSEVMLWKDWNLAFEPRLGPDEFARVRKTLHDRNTSFIVYTSPYYFLKGTPIESAAMNSFDNFEKTGFPSGWADGRNIDLFMGEIGKVMAQYQPDGLYFDGQYTENVPALYALARRARAVVGEHGLLEWHSTAALGDALCFLPQADAYVDFILRGEGRDANYADVDYLRYFVSGYNTSNSIGVLCNNSGKLDSALLQRLVGVNGRMHTLAGWLTQPDKQALVHEYRALLTPDLPKRIARTLEQRQQQVPTRARQRLDEFRTLRDEPHWGAPVFAARSADFAAWPTSVSPRNKDPFAVRDDALAITAHANTYAFATHPADWTPTGFVAKLKLDRDPAAAWGPAVAIRWKSGTWFRVGLRGDKLIQADISGGQYLFGRHDPAQWTWLRARWREHSLVIETSTDGAHYTQVWRHDHGGALCGPAKSVVVGKIPYNGNAIDHTDLGAMGTCWIGSLDVFDK